MCAQNTSPSLQITSELSIPVSRITFFIKIQITRIKNITSYVSYVFRFAMGVHGLWKLLEPAGKPVPLESLENKVLAVGILFTTNIHFLT